MGGERRQIAHVACPLLRAPRSGGQRWPVATGTSPTSSKRAGYVVHFYHLHALDWVDVVSALAADPAETSELAQSISDWPKSSRVYFEGVQKRLKGFVDRGQLGPFANAYWGHSAYKLPPKANLLAVAHYLEALDWQRSFIKIHAVLGGKNPHLQSFLVGGMATPVDPNQQASINIGTIASMTKLVAEAKDFVTRVYLPDLLAIASFYKDWAGYGAGVGNYLVYGEYPESEDRGAKLFIPSGVIRGKNLKHVEPFDQEKITEHIKHSWYSYDGGDDKGLHPYRGETKPTYTGPKPPYERLDTAKKYSWLKSPRYDGLPMEVGPLARMLVAYSLGHERVKTLVTGALAKLEVGPEALFSTLGRVAARGIETQVLVEKMSDWVDELAKNMGRGELRIHDSFQRLRALFGERPHLLHAGLGVPLAAVRRRGGCALVASRRDVALDRVLRASRVFRPPGLASGKERDHRVHLQRLQVLASRTSRGQEMNDAPGVLVLGLGNVLCGDDGVGVAIVHRLLAEYEIPEGVEVLDGGTLGMSLLSLVSDTEDLVLVDAVRADAPPGTLVVVEGDDVVPTVSERLSPHQVGVADVLAAARFLDRYPRRVVVLGVVPETLELGLGRTAAVEASLPALLQRVVEELAARGYPPTRRPHQLDGGDDRVLRALGL